MFLEINNLVKVYNKGFRANDGITLSIDRGEVFGLLGPNGAGKTTLVSQIIGLTVPSSGSIRVNGVDIITKPEYARQICSFQSQTQVPIAGLTSFQAIELVGLIRGGKKDIVRSRTRYLIESLDIGEWTNKMGATLSGGVRRIVAFCMAAVVPGQIVILDEPTNDIDPVRRRLLWNIVNSLAESGSTVLLVTHNVLEAERAVNRLALIDKGRVIGMGTPADIKGHNGNHMRLELIFEPGKSINNFPDFIEQPVSSKHRIVAKVNESRLTEVISWSQSLKKKGSIEEFQVGPTTLEDAYIRLVGRLDIIETAEGNNKND